MEWDGMPPFHGLFHGLLFGWVPTHVSIPYSLWIPYGMSMEYTIPYGFHGPVHMESMEFPMNLNSKSMYYSIRIPWIPWNSPGGFHGPFHRN